MACAKFYGQVVFGIIVLKFIYIAAVIHIAVIAVITVANCMDTSYLMIVCWWAARPNFEAVINEAAASIICQCKCTYLLAPLFGVPPQALKKIRQNRRVLTFSGSTVMYGWAASFHWWPLSVWGNSFFFPVLRSFHEKWSILSNASKESIRMT